MYVLIPKKDSRLADADAVFTVGSERALPCQSSKPRGGEKSGVIFLLSGALMSEQSKPSTFSG